MTPRRSRLWILVALLVVVPLVGVVTAYLWINAVADRRWAAAEARLRQLMAAYPETDSRPVPERITEASKDNQIHLVAAIRGAAAPRRNRERESLVLIVERTDDDTRLDPVLEEAQEFLDRMHQGARRIAASPDDFPPRWHGDWDPSTLRYMMNCAILRSRRQRKLKSAADAAETLLDSLQLARFWAISGRATNRFLAMDALPPILEELRELIASEDLTPEQFQSVDRELERLDQAMESPLRNLEPMMAHWGRAVIALERRLETGIFESASFSWRHLIPERLMKAEVVEFSDRHLQRLLDCERKPYADLMRELRLIDQETVESGNPLIRHASLFSMMLGWGELERKAQLRLLRAAARYRANGEFAGIGDPFGGAILHADQGKTVKFWSLGDDGKDDGGDAGAAGWWEQPILNPVPGVAPPRRGRDLVIEVPRRP